MGLQTDQPESFFDVAGEMPQLAGDIRGPSQAQQSDDQVAQGGHHLSRSALADSAAVLVEGHVADPVQPVFDAPVPAVELQKLRGRRDVGRHARDAVGDLATLLRPVQVADDPFDAEDLPDVWEIDVAVQILTRPDPPPLQPPVALIDRLRLRGETLPSRGSRCRSSRSADYL